MNDRAEYHILYYKIYYIKFTVKPLYKKLFTHFVGIQPFLKNLFIRKYYRRKPIYKKLIVYKI